MVYHKLLCSKQFATFWTWILAIVVLHLAFAMIDILQPGDEHGSTIVTAYHPFRGMCPNVLQSNTTTFVGLCAVSPAARYWGFGGFPVDRELVLYMVVDVHEKVLHFPVELLTVIPLASKGYPVGVNAISTPTVAVALGDANNTAEAGTIRFHPVVVCMEVYVAL